ncbi:ras-related protein Rab-18A-like [Hetaerina americana]|uniref:ras-related protein Rab-18A-like n=1 Tax=Hetaerina americana TaxID=62018 RepID=UPI003A7F343C
MEKYQDLMPQYYRSVHGFILVYDITNRPSFKHLDTLFTDVDTFATIEGNVKIIVGNKIDLGKSRTVPRSEGLKYAHSKGALFIETSALSNEAVDHIFEKLVTEVMKNPKLWTSPISQTIQIVNSPPVTPSTSCNC